MTDEKKDEPTTLRPCGCPTWSERYGDRHYPWCVHSDDPGWEKTE